MSETTGAGIGMTGGAIAFANDWYVTNKPNWRIAVATPIAGLFLYGAGKVSEPLSIGLGLAMLVTIVMTPISGQSPMQTIIKVTGSPQ